VVRKCANIHTLCEAWALKYITFKKCVLKDSGLQACDVVLLGEQFVTFQRTVVFTFDGNSRMTLQSVGNLSSNDRSHPKDLNFQN